MRCVGLFAELDPNRPEYFRGSIHDAVRPSGEPDEDALIGYLRSGIRLADIMESTPDVISNDRHITGGSSILTDGEWVWRVDLAYYVERYHVALDEEFVKHARSAGYRIPDHPRDRLIQLSRHVFRDVLNMS
jgi:hypothetical protein